ncbi:MAG: uL15 family ribosomal protein, partial [Nanoarchaeota archaeon]|nr:uL15 family ribosomal protein [Nanoarchaeota archaeon]
DLKKLGFNKLLSTGKITKKFSIKCEYASKKAIDKIKKAGGSIILEEKKPKKIKEKPKEEKPVAETAEKVEEKPIAQKAEKIETKEKEVKK